MNEVTEAFMAMLLVMGGTFAAILSLIALFAVSNTLAAFLAKKTAEVFNHDKHMQAIDHTLWILVIGMCEGSAVVAFLFTYYEL